MKIKMIEDIGSLEFGIKNYDPRDDWGIDVGFILRLGEPEGSLLFYDLSSKQVLSCPDVNSIIDCLQEAILDKETKRRDYMCDEPDLWFSFDNAGFELQVNFWADSVMTGNHVNVCFGRANMEYLWYYLLLITGQINKEDARIQKMITAGVLF